MSTPTIPVVDVPNSQQYNFCGTQMVMLPLVEYEAIMNENETMRKRINELDSLVVQLNTMIQGKNYEIEVLSRENTDFRQRVGELSTRVDSHDSKIEHVYQTIGLLTQRLEAVEKLKI
jgi:predicted  nucleic acid-binding Zn-ribbon protein